MVGLDFRILAVKCQKAGLLTSFYLTITSIFSSTYTDSLLGAKFEAMIWGHISECISSVHCYNDG